jgi:predicted nucleic acid-binding protein
MARRAWPAGRRVFDSFAELMSGRIESVLAADVRAAAELAAEYPSLDGRDLVHVAVMTRLGVNQIVSADRAFDRIADIERLDPARFSEWRRILV